MRLLVFLPFVGRSQARRLIHTFAPTLEHKCESRFLDLFGLPWWRPGLVGRRSVPRRTSSRRVVAHLEAIAAATLCRRLI